MISVVFSNPKNKTFLKVSIFFVSCLFIFFSVSVNEAKACAAALGTNGLGGEWIKASNAISGTVAGVVGADKDPDITASQNETLVKQCQTLMAVATKIPCTMVLGTDIGNACAQRDACLASAQTICDKAAADSGAVLNAKKLIDNAKAKDKIRETLAFAFKSALKTFSRQVAHDTAVWVASGGKGQQPLFITEGWGPYLQNTADSALGQFIDGIGTQYGVNLCQPDFRVKLMIQTSLNYSQPQKITSCSFSKIMTNWEGAISSASFAVDYRNAMRPGANDISFMLQMADQRNSYVGDAVNTATKKAQTDYLWTPITNVAGKILTPGTVVANTFRDNVAAGNTTLGLSTFTNTAADMVEEFGNTLVSQLLKGLQGGMFGNSNSGGSTGNSNGNILPDPSVLAGLFNFNSSPLVAGTVGAQEKFLSLITNQEKVGNRYDLLLQLASCSDAAKSNMGPTDCVIDNSFSTEIRKRIYVKDLPSDPKGTNILGRAFAPQISQTNSLETEIPFRSILILRKYRIVPVGWEIAANLIANKQVFNADGISVNTNNWTLGQVMNCYYGSGVNGCTTNSFKNLVDPYWVLKSYEAFCRREGYGGHNEDALSQDNSITRSQYCSDEQQCLQDDSKGNCKAYGYCTQERRLWDLGTTCDARYNTCQTYADRSGSAGSLLKNSLDFSNCSNLNVGCQAFTGNFNVADAIWNGEFLNESNVLQIYAPSDDAQPLSISNTNDWKVPQYRNVSNNSRLKISQTCTPELCSGVAKKCEYSASTKTCNFNQTGNTCITAPGAISCMVEACYEQGNIISGLNPGFENVAGAGDAELWTDELAYFNLNNRDYRTTDQKRTSNASLHAVAGNNPVDLVTTLPNIPLDKNNANYTLKFWAKGSVTAGQIQVGITAGTGSGLEFLAGASYPLIGSLGDWKEYVLQFSSKGHATGTIAITTLAGSVADVYFDDFRIQKMTSACQNSVSIMLFTSPISAPNKNNSSNLYLDRDAATCSADNDGCSLFLRNKANTGGNLIYNGGFEHGLAGWGDQYFNDPTSAWATNTVGGATISYDPSGYISYKPITIDGGDYYSIAFDAARTASASLAQSAVLEMIFVNVKDDATSATGRLNVPALNTNCATGTDNTLSLSLSPKGTDFERTSCWFKAPVGAKLMMFKPFVASNGGSEQLNVDNFKLEKVSLNSLVGSAYTAYDPSLRLANQVSYLKKAPDYFNCYKTLGGKWPETTFELTNVLQNRNQMCSTYSGVCTKKEVGCEAYTPKNGDPLVPGVVDNLDLCLSECVGYQVYKQESTFFATSTFKQFIADNKAKYCSAADAGCDEFTNLDVVGQGAEVKEYYSELRACQRPNVDDANYYTWEGSDTTGYQLKSYTLKKSNLTTAACTNLKYYLSNAGANAGKNYCDDANSTAICSQDQMITNPDCRELYDVDGNISYRLLSKTITISDNCHPYRRTQTQLTVAQAQADCIDSHGYFNANSECVYMSIPTEARSCSVAAKGCRAYTGNQGNNVRNVIEVQNFAAGTSTNDLWFDTRSPITKTGLKISTESTFPGGNSLSNATNADNIQRKVTLTKNKTYVLSFWAKGDLSYYIDSIKFSDAPASDSFTYSRVVGDNLLGGRVQITNNWRYYELGPVFVSWDPAIDDYLVFNLGGQKIYLDNVILKEISNKVYLIENSWYTPVSCDNRLDDSDGKKAIAAGTCQDSSSGRCSVGEMIGCQAYTDRFKNPWYLRSFSSLCREEAVGCEALVDTHNSESPDAMTVNTGADVNGYDADVVTVPADETVYMVNRAEFSCQASAKGCTAVGLPSIDRWDQTLGYSTLFLKNDPDNYDTSMCKHDELWCEQYTTNDSTSYFKDPHGKICSYGQPNASTSIGWYKSGTDIPCQTTNSQTFGTGYDILSDKMQPIGPVSNFYPDVDVDKKQIWAGTCPTAQSGCTEFIDPLPFMYSNEVSDTLCHAGATSCTNIKLKANTLYAYQLGGGALTVTTTDLGCTVFPDVNNGSKAGGVGEKFFYINKDTNGYCLVTISKDGTNTFNFTKDTRDGGDKIVIAGVYYGLKNQVNKSSCAGQVDFNNSCVLFNDRSQIDYSIIPSDATNTAEAFANRNYNYLTYDAYTTFTRNLGLNSVPQQVNPVLVTAGGDSSVILRVAPNRACKSWLSCTTYEKGNASDPNPYFSASDKCLALENCQYLDANGQCGDYYQASSTELVSSDQVFANYSGYSSPGSRNFASMTQYGESSQVINGNFESSFNGTGEPMGWMRAMYVAAQTDPAPVQYPWESRLYKVTSEVIGNQGDGAKEGSSYLKLSGAAAVISEQAEILPQQTYVLSGWVNTQNLTGQGDTFADVQVRFLNSNNTPDKSGAVSVVKGLVGGTNTEFQSGAGWWFQYVPSATNSSQAHDILVAQNINSTRIPAGKSWTEFKLEFKNTSNDTMSLEIALLNMDGAGTPAYSNSGLGGYTAWDAIDIKPVLQPNTDDVIQRSCRQYPNSDSPACQYSGTGGQNFYGQYGYCMLIDPKNNQQCLQWWPIDTIKGDMVSDFSGYYKERTPLYYCLEKQSVTIDYGKMMGRLGVYGQGADTSGYSNWKIDRNGEQIQVNGFDVPNGWAPLFRYPFVYKFNFVGAFFTIGSTASKTMFFSIINATMWPKAVCHGILPTVGSVIFGQGIIDGLGCSIYKQANVAQNTTSTIQTIYACYSDDTIICSQATDCNNGVLVDYRDKACDSNVGTNDVCNAAYKDSAKCEKVQDNWWDIIAQGAKDAWNKLVVALDDLTGAILGTNISKLGFNEDDQWGGFGAVAVAIPIPGINFIPWIGMPWHVAQNFDNSLLSNALSLVSILKIKPSTLGLKIITDTDTSLSMGSNMTDLHPQSGDILGYGFFWKNAGMAGAGDKTGFATLSGNLNATSKVEYCSKLVRVVTSAGQNKAWSAKLSSGSSYQAEASDCIADSESSAVAGKNCFYQSSYCLSHKVVGDRTPYNLCGNYIGESGLISDPGTASILFCRGGNSEDVMNGSATGPRNYNYYCDRNSYIFSLIYAYNNYTYTTDYRPYGSLMPPTAGQYPTDWDSRPATGGKQPLFYETPVGTVPYQARMGQTYYNVSNLQKIFAKTYGYWEFVGGIGSDGQSSGYYINKTETVPANQWSLPGYCGVDGESRTGDAFCKVRPQFVSTSMTHVDNRTMKLSFAVKVDSEQLPITGFVVDWGDGQTVSYAGVSLVNHPDPSNPFMLYHAYDYSSLKKAGVNCSSGGSALTCTGFNVTTTVYDNWQAAGVTATPVSEIKF